MDPTRDESRLVEAARRGSHGAFAQLVRTHQQAVRGFLRRLRAAEEADDAAQEAFVAAWSALPRFDGRSSFRSWVCAIAWRKLRDQRRGEARRLAREERATQTAPLTTSQTTDEKIDAVDLLEALPPDQRAAVALCLAGDFSHAEAAAALGLPLGTVKSLVTRGRMKLLEVLGDRDD